MKPTLYGAPLSPFVRKARIVLAEKGIDYDLVPLDPFRKSEELLRLSPLGRVPALVDDGKTLADSGVIAQYLEKKWRDAEGGSWQEIDLARLAKDDAFLQVGI